jgi:hypothetical protein
LFDSLLTSRKGFFDFVKTHWDRVLHAAFVFQVQPLNPDLQPFIALAQPATDGEGKGTARAAMTRLKGYQQEGTYYNWCFCDR